MKINITRTKYRRGGGGRVIIEVCRFVHGKYMPPPFTYDNEKRSRVHTKKDYENQSQPKPKTGIFSDRVVVKWSSLPDELVNLNKQF